MKIKVIPNQQRYPEVGDIVYWTNKGMGKLEPKYIGEPCLITGAGLVCLSDLSAVWFTSGLSMRKYTQEEMLDRIYNNILEGKLAYFNGIKEIVISIEQGVKDAAN